MELLKDIPFQTWGVREDFLEEKGFKLRYEK